MDEFGIILFLILLFIILPIIGWAILLGRIGEVSKRLLSMEAMLEKLLEKKTDTSTEEEVVAVPPPSAPVEVAPVIEPPMPAASAVPPAPL